MSEVLAHFHGGPLGSHGVRRVLDEAQAEYRFIDDITGRTGVYARDEGGAGGRCFEWMGWS